LTIVDSHVHLLSFPSLENLEDKIRTSDDVIRFRTAYPELYYAARSEEAIDNAHHLIEAMDRNGVGQALVSPTSGNTTNDQLAAAVRKHPGRLFGLARIGHKEEALGFPDDPTPLCEQAPRQLEYCLDVLGMKGLGEAAMRALTRATHPEDIAQDLAPILRTLAKYRAPWQIPTAWTQFPGGLYYGDPLFVDEIAQRYPEVPIILTKMGRSIQHLFDNALMVALRNENVYFDTVGTTSAHLRIAVERIGAHRIMFGTDWAATWRWVRHPADLHTLRLRVVEDAKLSTADREQVLWKTASTLFDLMPSAAQREQGNTDAQSFS
jgi:predicted TIM-barrel fold metal-dependent hydrolase